MGLSWWWLWWPWRPWWEEDGLDGSKAEGYAPRHEARQRRRRDMSGREMVEKGHATSGPCFVALNKTGGLR